MKYRVREVISYFVESYNDGDVLPLYAGSFETEREAVAVAESLANINFCEGSVEVIYADSGDTIPGPRLGEMGKGGPLIQN